MTLSPEHQAEIDASRAATRTTLSAGRGPEATLLHYSEDFDLFVNIFRRH